MSVAISMKDLPGVLKKFDAETRKRLKRAMRTGAERGRGILVRRTPTDTGQARAGWHVGMYPGDLTGGQEVARITNDAPHIGIVESGARPHPVSEAGWMAIFRWVMRHHDVIGAGAGAVATARRRLGAKRLSRHDVATNAITGEAAAITNAIVWKLRTKGQSPTYFVKHALPELRRAMAAEVKREMDELLKHPPEHP